MTKTFLACTIITLSLFLAACCDDEIVTYTDPERTINTVVGEEFIVSYQLDPAGCYWQEHHDQDMLYLIEETYGPVQKDSNALTFAGTQYFRYKSLKSGITYVTLTLFRSNEPDIVMEKVFQVNIKSVESNKTISSPRILTSIEKNRVIEIALSTPEVSTWVRTERDYRVGPVQWYAIWPHEWMVFNYSDLKTDPNYKLVPESAVWYPGFTITFEETTTTHLIEFQVAIDLGKEEVVWLFGPIAVNG